MPSLPERGQAPAERAGDWIERNAAAVHAAVHRLCPKSAGVDPEDLAQEVRIRLWRAVLAQTEIRNVPAFVRAVTLHAAADALRLVRGPRPLSLEGGAKADGDARDAVAGHETDPADDAADRESMEKAMGNLLDSRRRVVVLHLAGFSRGEIAQRLDHTPDKVRNLLYRGLEDLRTSLQTGGNA